MKRTERPPARPDAEFMMRAIKHLDECLKRGVVIGVYEDSMEVSDEDVVKALTHVRQLIDATIGDMERLARAFAREKPSSIVLQ